MGDDSPRTRRALLHLFGGAAALLITASKSSGREALIAKLIEEARAHGAISERIAFISAALRGTRYLGYTLIGGPRRPEVFVVRDDGFDCVTYCETVLAAAIARNIPEFESVLREIRYQNGVVSWAQRNHYFFEWGEHNTANNICKPVIMDGSIEIEKTVYWQKELGRRRFVMTVIPHAVFYPTKPSSGTAISSAL